MRKPKGAPTESCNFCFGRGNYYNSADRLELCLACGGSGWFYIGPPRSRVPYVPPSRHWGLLTFSTLLFIVSAILVYYATRGAM